MTRQTTERYIVGAVGDWWIDRPPIFSSLKKAVDYYASGKAKDLFCGNSPFIAKELRFKPLVDKNKGVVSLVPTNLFDNACPYYTFNMYKGEDRGFVLGAHLTKSYSSLRKLLQSVISRSPNIIIAQGLELKLLTEATKK